MVAYLVPTVVTPTGTPALMGIVVRGGLATTAYLVTLFASGFFHQGEFKVLKELRDRITRKKSAPAGDQTLPPEEEALP